MIGATLAHYEITAKLGEGGMGEVYRATDTRLSREVALKVLPAEMSGDPARLARFEREAKTVAALNHPNIVTLYSVEEAGGVHFLTMELVEGQTLDRHVPAGGAGLARFFELAVPIADALADAHAQGITHRDLKPANVMVTEKGQVKVLDFGLAKLSETGSDDADETLTQDGLILGTVQYMSPEQTMGRPADHRSDVFSLGVLLYEMATGRRPFGGASVAELMSSILRDEPPPVTEVKAGLPNHLGRVVRRCLEKEPSKRYQNALEIRNELEDLKKEVDSDTAGVATPARSAVRAPASWSWRTGVAAILVLLGVAGLSWWALHGPERGQRTSTADGTGVTTPAEDDRKMIVVLPFENLGPPDDEYFAAGMTEEITSRLAAVGDLGVISHKSARTYAGSDKTTRQIGSELGVDYIVDGTVRWAARGSASRIRISPRLVRVADDTHLWGDTLDRDIRDVFELQTDIATSVARELGSVLGATGKTLEIEPPTENIEAYQEYLRGRDAFVSPDLAVATEAIVAYERAVKLDPEFAEAHARLGSMHAMLVHLGADRTEQRRKLGAKAIERAIALKPESAEVRLSSAYYRYWAHRSYSAALAELDLAEQTSGADAEILMVRSFIFARLGRLGDAVAALAAARRLNPRDPTAAFQYGWMVSYLGRAEEAIGAFDQAELLRPAEVMTAFGKAAVYWRSGSFAQARMVLEAMPRKPDDSAYVFSWWWQHIYEQDFAAALEILEETALEEIVLLVRYPVPWMQGVVLRTLGREAEAVRAFESALRIAQRKLDTAAGDPTLHSAVAFAYAGLGRDLQTIEHGERALEVLPAEGDAQIEGWIRYDMAGSYAMLGRVDEAVFELEKTLTAAFSGATVPMVDLDPRFDRIRDAPEFRSVLARHRTR